MAVSAYTQVEMEDAHKLLKIPKSECPDIWIRLPRHKWDKSWSSMENPVVPLERNLSAGSQRKRKFEQFLLEMGWEKVPNWELVYCCLYTLITSFWLLKKNMAPTWKKLMKRVDLDEPTSFLDQVFLGCTQRECKPNEGIVVQYKNTDFVSYHWRINKKVPAWIPIISRRMNLNQLENCQKFAQNCFNMLVSWREMVDQTFYGPVNKLAQEETKWTQACDRRSHSSHRKLQTILSRGKCRHSIVDCSKTPILLETLRTRNQHWVEFCAQTSVSHSPTRIGNHFIGCWIANG